MAAKLLRRIDLTKIYPPLVERSRKLVAACRERGADYWAISGLRSWEEQGELYALGRTKPNVDATPEKPMGGIVTKARPGYSYHNYGLALDFARDKDEQRAGLQPTWDAAKYGVLAEQARKLRLEAGFFWRRFPDAPHVQIPTWGTPGLNLAKLRALHEEGGIPRVWAWLDKNLKW